MLLGVVADLSIWVGERRLVHEQMFPVVELAASLRRWLDSIDKGDMLDFTYESMESAEGPLLQFLRRDSGWKVCSPLQEYEENQLLTTEEVRGAARQFMESVEREAAAQMNLEVGRWIAADNGVSTE